MYGMTPIVYKEIVINMTNKIYTLIGDINLVTTVKLGNGKVCVVSFDGGQRSSECCIHGKFMTNDPELQKAIERDSGYGREFKLLAEDGCCVIDKNDQAHSNEEIVSQIVEIHDVSNKQSAILYLKQNFDLDVNPTMRVEEVKLLANQYNVAFPNW